MIGRCSGDGTVYVSVNNGHIMFFCKFFAFSQLSFNGLFRLPFTRITGIDDNVHLTLPLLVIRFDFSFQ